MYLRKSLFPIIKEIIGHNHISEIKHFNTKDESIGPDILEFIKINPAKTK